MGFYLLNLTNFSARFEKCFPHITICRCITDVEHRYVPICLFPIYSVFPLILEKRTILSLSLVPAQKIRWPGLLPMYSVYTLFT